MTTTTISTLTISTINAGMLSLVDAPPARGSVIQDAYFYALACAGDDEALVTVTVSGYTDARKKLIGALARLGWAHVKGPKSRRDSWRVAREIREYALHVYGVDAVSGDVAVPAMWLHGAPSHFAARCRFVLALVYQWVRVLSVDGNDARQKETRP